MASQDTQLHRALVLHTCTRRVTSNTSSAGALHMSLQCRQLHICSVRDTFLSSLQHRIGTCMGVHKSDHDCVLVEVFWLAVDCSKGIERGGRESDY